MSIIAVSNGRYLLGRGLGKQIDAFDEVVRFNHAPAGKYADDVGVKTTIWTFTSTKTEKELSRFDTPGHLCRKLWWCANWDRHWAKPQAGPRIEVIPVDVEEYIRGAIGLADDQMPTTGLTTLVYLLREFETIHLAGWYKGEAGRSREAFLPEYFGPLPDPNKPVWQGHCPKLEERFIQSLTDEGRLVDIETIPEPNKKGKDQ